MEFFLELIFEIFIEGIFATVHYLFNKFFKHKVSDKTAKIVSGVLSATLIIGAFIIIIFIINEMTY